MYMLSFKGDIVITTVSFVDGFETFLMLYLVYPFACIVFCLNALIIYHDFPRQLEGLTM